MTEELIGTAEIARRLGVSPGRARQLCQERAFQGGIKLGRDWYVPPAEVDAFQRRPRGNPNWVRKEEGA